MTTRATEAGARAICCKAHLLGCAARNDGSPFSGCQAHTYRKDAEAMMEALKAEGFVVVPEAALKWLFGEAPDADGNWFEPPEIKAGERKRPYWWRSKFRAMLSAAQEPTCK